ncbi:HepT-like ribonuclease domain-containing protein [Nubsella zeaxanthinifaciens]|uniref:HepT-like ribonuclease domain-containing protein n=1 Tax=Nubsella zeaxanthinifaciens TaxID=392412 RepID=UPI003D091974
MSHIELYVQPIKSIDELLLNNLIYDAVQMNFIIIDEASKRISKGVKENNPQIDWKGIISYRNFVVHEYFGVDIKVLWSAITYELPS